MIWREREREREREGEGQDDGQGRQAGKAQNGWWGFSRKTGFCMRRKRNEFRLDIRLLYYDETA